MKIGLLITARLKSSRLPLKLLLDLNGKTVVERVIERAKVIKGLDGIVLCTSLNPQDKPLTDIALKNNIHYFLGDSDDVLKRLLDAATFFGYDYLLNITGENPLFSVEYAERVIDEIRRKGSDYTFYEGLPLGCAVYGIKTKALQVVCNVKKEIDTEIWGPLINRPEIFSVCKNEVHEFYRHPGIRITNDYLEDYLFLLEIFKNFTSDAIPSLTEVLVLFKEKPSILEINKSRVQAALAPDVLNRIDDFYTKNKEEITKLKSKIYSQYDN